MREHISLDRQANAIRMERSVFSGAFLLVEGSTDKIFYKYFVNGETCKLVVISGKPSSKKSVIGVLDILEKSDFQGILAIIDADFDRLETSCHHSSNLFQTDTHDLETLLLKSFALEKVIAELGSEDKICQFGEVRTALLEAGGAIGYLRWISQRDELNLTFEGIKFSNFINKETLKIDEFKLIQEVKNKSQKLSLKNEDLQQRLTNQKNNDHDLWQVCCGHDLVEILCLGLRKIFGSIVMTPENLERDLRLAYEKDYFRKTQLFSEIQAWENSHQPFQVLLKET